MAPSRLEVNFTRLLCRCESIALHKRGESEWRLEKYVGALEDMLVGLKRSSSKPATEVLKDYSRKVDFLKRLFDAEKLPSTTEKAMANRLLAPGQRISTANEKVSSKTGPGETVVRHRRALRLVDRLSAKELDSMLRKHRLLQEQLKEDVLQLARSLKNNSLASRGLIAHHSQALPQTMWQVDGDVEGLWVESEQPEQRAKMSVSWFLRLVLFLGGFIFISTILFIGLFPKLT